MLVCISLNAPTQELSACGYCSCPGKKMRMSVTATNNARRTGRTRKKPANQINMKPNSRSSSGSRKTGQQLCQLRTMNNGVAIREEKSNALVQLTPERYRGIAGDDSISSILCAYLIERRTIHGSCALRHRVGSRPD